LVTKGAGKALGALVTGQTSHINTVTVPRTEHQAPSFKSSVLTFNYFLRSLPYTYLVLHHISVAYKVNTNLI